MSELLPSGPALLGFLAAAFVLAVTPGPGVAYVVTRTLAQGKSAGLASVAGVALGNFGNAAGATLGLAALFAVSSAAFTVVKYAGAAYLLYLGLQALRQAGPQPTESRTQPVRPARVLRDGFFVALLNPKTTLFFASFLPQFIDPSASPVRQSLALSGLFVALAALSDTTYVLLARAVAPVFRSTKAVARYGSYATACVYVSLGLYAALSGSRPAKH